MQETLDYLKEMNSLNPSLDTQFRSFLRDACLLVRYLLVRLYRSDVQTMLLWLLEYIQKILPFSTRKVDDLKVSNDIVCTLAIPERTKQFVFAFYEPETKSTVYVLSAQNLSEQAALDASCLISVVRPEAVVVHVSSSALIEILKEEHKSRDCLLNSVPTTLFEVLKDSIIAKTRKEVYYDAAGSFVLQEIFGIGFHGHHLSAKKAAMDVGSTFIVIHSLFVNSLNDSCEDVSIESKFLKQLGLALTSSEYDQSRCNYQAPPFARSIYPLLKDLKDIFYGLPLIERALDCSQKLLTEVNRGGKVDEQLLSEVQTFRLAVEGIRIAQNNAARCPYSKLPCQTNIRFSDFSEADKSHFFLAQFIRSQTKRFKSIVAVVETNSLSGLRRFWRTPIEVSDSSKELCQSQIFENDAKRLQENPMLVAGGCATIFLGASSVSKAASISTFLKMFTFKIPFSVKLLMLYAQEEAIYALDKLFGPSKVVACGISSYGATTTSILKAAASGEKLRVMAQSLIASAEYTSLSVMQTAFYAIMRRRPPLGTLPWTVLGCSVASFAGLFIYGDNIEFAAESLPTASSIASLGRGIQNLHETSQEVIRQADCSTSQEALEFPVYSCNKVKRRN